MCTYIHAYIRISYVRAYFTTTKRFYAIEYRIVFQNTLKANKCRMCIQIHTYISTI